MSPKPIIESSQYDDPRSETTYCQDCQRSYWTGLGHDCLVKPRMSWASPIVGLALTLISVLMVLGVLYLSFGDAKAHARANTPHPISAPQSLLRARQACPNTASLVQCRGALRRALQAVEWQRSENLKLARSMVGNVSAWTCIHHGEGSWTDTRDPYWGGLQMDRGFMRQYGLDMIARHHGWANTWTPREQIIVAQRAFIQGRGYAPWPVTSRACGLR